MSVLNDEAKSSENWDENIPRPERLPKPSVYPVTLSFGVTLLAFGVVTHWMISLAGLAVFMLGAGGWFKELRDEQFQ